MQEPKIYLKHNFAEKQKQFLLLTDQQQNYIQTLKLILR